ncbi:magnesium/cobalt transporter CorA [Candidatus Woesearchaeota archaeon]|nr:magnesium/cobalt transporter CorA [Candidatus Woesearchaeota archaeon]
MVNNHIKKRGKKHGLPPGTLIHVGEKKSEKVKLTLVDYNEKIFKEFNPERVEECFTYKNKKTVTWVNVDGLHDVKTIEKIGECFQLHPLVLEDLLNTDQRPKVEDYGDYLFFVLKLFYHDEDEKEIIVEQVSIVLGEDFVISFQEQPSDVFNNLKDRISQSKGRIRKAGADYLVYSLLDTIVDHYFLVLEKVGEQLGVVEERLTRDPTPKALKVLQSLKRDMIFLRKAIWPVREVIAGFERATEKLLKKSTGLYLRDVHDHTVQVIDTIETFRDMIGGMQDIYLSSLSHKMNEVMKVLTAISTIFIPLTLIASIYGMNFKYMPELNWRYGYIGVMSFMLVIGLLLAYYFKKKEWL